MTATKVGAVELRLPVILYFDGGVTVVGDRVGFEARGMEFIDEQTMVCKEHSIEELPGWLIELNGNLREFSPRGKRREWARPLNFLWRFTLSEFQVALPCQITVGALYERIKNIKERSREAPIVTDLRRFLKTLNGDDVVKEEILRKWPI